MVFVQVAVGQAVGQTVGHPLKVRFAVPLQLGIYCSGTAQWDRPH